MCDHVGGTQNSITSDFLFLIIWFLGSGHWSDVVPPFPIPNREVKRISADNSFGATWSENRS